MDPEIRMLKGKTLIGKKMMMSFSENKTFQLWKSFIPHRDEIENTIGNELFSIEVYPEGYFDNFNPAAQFLKWAAVEVSKISSLPEGMAYLIIPSGRYAVFIHQGSAAQGFKTYEYIFGVWLPGSGYYLDDRPHFAVMGEKYRVDDPDSEEEIWIPVKPR